MPTLFKIGKNYKLHVWISISAVCIPFFTGLTMVGEDSKVHCSRADNFNKGLLAAPDKGVLKLPKETDNDITRDFFVSIKERKMSTCIIKLGGSSCTVKNSFETYHNENVLAFSEHLMQICKENNSYRPIVIHGAGSFGHFQAKSFSVNGGALSNTGKPAAHSEFISPFLREGFVKTRLSVTGLNHKVVATMGNAGLPAVGVSPFPYIPMSDRRLESDSWSWRETTINSISTSLHMGLIPVLHGDACIDTTAKVTGILSGDTLFPFLCEEFSPTHAVFLTDVDGVYTAPPSTPGAELIDEIWVDDFGKWKMISVSGTVLELDYAGKWHKYKISPSDNQKVKHTDNLTRDKDTTESISDSSDSSDNSSELITSVSSHDVTGGIENKINSAIEVARTRKIPVFIVRVASPSALTALKGFKPERGTTIKYQEHVASESNYKFR